MMADSLFCYVDFEHVSTLKEHVIIIVIFIP